ncbi:MAG: insulinase family protein [Planctomycetes bacterium]|nr:insulinase family protein [Planctomycetota bacterium]
MLKSLRLIAYLAVAVAPASSLADAPADRPLPSDPGFLSGTLENGVRYLLREHGTPPGKLAMIVHVRAGSLNETEAQRGLAHFLEHMAFNGTEHFAPGTLVPYFESIGMVFGDGANAFTGYDQTSYMLFLPDTTPERIDEGMKVLSDFVFRQLLLPAEIEKERGVILEEKRMRKGVEARLRERVMDRLFAGSRFAERLPIGTEEVISGAPREEFERFYRTWYRPELMTVILVGDVKPEAVEPGLAKWFGTSGAKLPSREYPGTGVVPLTSARAIVLSDPEVTSAEVGFTTIRAGRPPATTVAGFRRDLVEGLAMWIADRRLAERLSRGEASWQSAQVNMGSLFGEALIVGAGAEGEPANWNRMLDEVVMEVSRVLEHGFSARELELARADALAGAERAVSTESTTEARGLMFRALRAVGSGESLLSPEQELALAKELLPAVSVEELDAAFRALYSGDAFAFTLVLPEREGFAIPSEEEYLAAARAARARKTEPLSEAMSGIGLLAKEPEPGEVVETARDEDLGLSSVWLGNGVQVHHRFLDYRRDTVLVTVSLAGGVIEEDASNAGITEAAARVFHEPATGRLDSSRIRDLLVGRRIRLGAEVEGDVLTVTLAGSPKDLPQGFALLHALLTDGRLEAPSFEAWRAATLSRLTMMERSVEARAVDAFRQIVAGTDPRLMPPSAERTSRLALEPAQAWFTRLCREATIEVAVVGEIGCDEALTLAAKYLGSLPARKRAPDHLAALRAVARDPGPHARHVPVDTVSPQGMAVFGFFGPDTKALDDVRLLRMASNILDSRMAKRIREEMGLAYATQAALQPGAAFPGTGIFAGLAPCDPAKAPEVVAEMAAIFAAFAEKGPDGLELANAKKQILETMGKELREPRYWSAILSHLTLRAVNVARLKTMLADYEGYTAEQVRDAFRKYHQPDRLFRVTAVPAAKTPAPAEEPAEAPAGAESR